MQEIAKPWRESGHCGTLLSAASGSQCTSGAAWCATSFLHFIGGVGLPRLRWFRFVVRLSGWFIGRFFIRFLIVGLFLCGFLLFLDQGFLFFFAIGAFGNIARAIKINSPIYQGFLYYRIGA